MRLPEKLLGDGFLTPIPLFCLICTIISNKTCILDLYQKTNYEYAWFDTIGRVPHPPYSKKPFGRVLSLRDRVLSHGWSGDDLKLEVETYYLRRMYSVSSDVSQFEWEAPR